MYAVRLDRRDFSGEVLLPGDLKITPRRLSWAAVGGPDEAELHVYGAGVALGQVFAWLRCGVCILDDAGVPVWWGYVHDVEVPARPGCAATVGLSLGDMRNGVDAGYTKATPAGTSGRGTTMLFYDTASCLEYGTRNERLAVGPVMDAAGAERIASSYVAVAGRPQPTLDLSQPVPRPAVGDSFGTGAAVGAVAHTFGGAVAHTFGGAVAVIRCRGWWDTLGWLYYLDETGRVGSISGGTLYDVGAHNERRSVAQQVIAPMGAATWAFDKVAIKGKSYGLPTDGLRLAVRADGGGLPGAFLATGDVPGVTGSLKWLTVPLDAPVNMESGVPLWLEIGRTWDGLDADNFFQVSVDLGRPYTGKFKVWDNGAAVWVGAVPDCDLAFVISGAEETSTQLGRMLAWSEFLTGYEIEAPSGVSTCPYRDGDRRLRYEVEDLLALGISTGGRYLAAVDAERFARVYAEPDGSECYRLAEDGRLYGPRSSTGGLGLEPIDGAAPMFGEWLKIDGLEWLAETNWLEDLSKVFIERCELDCATGIRKLIPRRPLEARRDLVAGLRPYVAGWVAD